MEDKFHLVMEDKQSTVVARYTPDKKRAEHYQSEAELEQAFINQLKKQAYEYISITSDSDLKANLRIQIQKLNEYEFSDTEWEQFFKHEIAEKNKGITDKTKTIQEDYVKNLKCDDGSIKNIHLIDKKNIHENFLQVINQYATDTGQYSNRYDVTILVNGLPLVHVELKRRGVAIREAFNQINRYQRESFWADSGLYEYVQLFVISNGTDTKYYSNTVREGTRKEGGGAVQEKRF